MFRKKKVKVEATQATLKQLGAPKVDADILAHVISSASRMGQSAQQAALEAVKLQQMRKSGKRVIITDDG